MGLLFGILALICGIVGAWMAGWVGVGLVGIFAVVAVVYTVLRNNTLPEDVPKKKAGIVTAIIGVVLVLLMQLAVIAVGNKMKALAPEEFPIISESADTFKKTGALGVVNLVSKKGYSSEALNEELSRWRKKLGASE